MRQNPRTPRARAIARQAERPSMLPWVLLALALSVVAAHAQSNSTANPPVMRDTPSTGTPGVSAQGSGPQMAAPAGANAGKSVITPPNVDSGIASAKPAPGAYPMPVIPPGQAGSSTAVPK